MATTQIMTRITTPIFVLVLSFVTNAHSKKAPSQLSSDAWSQVFSKSKGGYTKKPLVPGITVLNADASTVATFHRFFPSLSEIPYHSCVTQLEAQLGAELPKLKLQDAGLIVFEPTMLKEGQSQVEGVLLTWTRYLQDDKTQEIQQHNVSARTCKTDGVAKRIMSYDRAKYEKLAKNSGAKNLSIAKYVELLQAAERTQARVKILSPDKGSSTGGRMPASMKGP